MKKSNKSKGRFSKLIVAFCILQILIFTYVCLYVSGNGGIIPDALIYGFFAVFGVELSGCVLIKNSKTKFTNTGIEKIDKSKDNESEEE